MMPLAQAYTEAARRLMDIADQLAKNPDDPDWIAGAQRDSLAILEHLGGLEPSQQVGAQLHRLYSEFKAAGTITPDKIREIAQVCGKVAQNNAQMAAQWNNIF